ncbi:solute carrier family 49 member 4-like isoform X1 [Haliotis asinina]|uniref:solute carrier family 49 member 4-like isoform X1 n=1 Tax=Haliotis asinina TaxID=109174 RepID=UPI003531EE45
MSLATMATDDMDKKSATEVNGVTIVPESRDLGVYKRRWYILTMFALLNSLQAAVWIQWGPIAAAAEQAYGWTDGTIALFANWGPITYIPTALLWSWMLDSKGLRTSCLGAAGLVALGTGLRCVYKDPPAFTVLVHLCQILNGLAGPIAMGAVPKVSSVWFPASERTTASTVIAVVLGLGITAAFYIGPQVVPEMTPGNCTFTNVSRNASLLCEDEVIEIQRQNIMYYNYGTFGVCALLFLVMLVYFPNTPPKPPSVSAAIPRPNYRKGLRLLVKNPRFWQLAVAYGVSTGTRDAWSSMLDVNLKAHGISQEDASYLGVYATAGTIVISLTLARAADYLKTRHKLFLCVQYGLSIVSRLWLVLLIVGILPQSTVSMYVAYGFVDLSSACVGPLFYETACDTSYPVAEGTTNVCLTTQNNIAALIFLGVLSIPGIGTVWMNWLLIAAYVFAFLLLVTLPVAHTRTDVDQKTH